MSQSPNSAAPEGRNGATPEGRNGATPEGRNGAEPEGRSGGQWSSIEVSIFAIATRGLWTGQ